MFAAGLMFASCEQEVPETFSPNSESTKELGMVEEAMPEVAGEVLTIQSGDNTVTLQQKNGKYVWMGDILLTDEQVDRLRKSGDSERTGLSNIAEYWYRGRVYYDIDPSLPNQSRVTDAIAHWQLMCPYLTFIQRTSTYTKDYIYFTPGSGCSSYIGKKGGKQDITLASACSTGNTIHEIGHAIGLFHEQSRTDRGSYITINYGNIESGKSHNFDTYTQKGRSGFQLGTLDFGSIMMYGPYFFSKNGLPTITRLNGSIYSYQRSSLSSGDVEVVDEMYGPPFAYIEYDNEYSEDNYYGDVYEEADVYVAFYWDKARTQPYSLPGTRTFSYKEFRDYYGGYGLQSYSRSKTLSGGSSRYLLKSRFVTEECTYDYGNPEPGCHYSYVEVVDGNWYNQL